MSFDDLLAILAGILVVVFLIILNVKILISKKNILFKIIIFILTLFFSLPAWYLIQFAVTFVLSNTIPKNKNVNCIYLNEINCKRRNDCQLSYPDGMNIKPTCIYKSSSK